MNKADAAKLHTDTEKVLTVPINDRVQNPQALVAELAGLDNIHRRIATANAELLKMRNMVFSLIDIKQNLDPVQVAAHKDIKDNLETQLTALSILDETYKDAYKELQKHVFINGNKDVAQNVGEGVIKAIDTQLLALSEQVLDLKKQIKGLVSNESESPSSTSKGPK